MTNKLTSFRIFKVKEHSGDMTKPTHNMSAQVGEDFRYIGRCWTKEGANNSKFLSCQLDNIYEDKPGYFIEIDLPKIESVVDPSDGRDLGGDSPF